MEFDETYRPLIEYLRERGHTDEQIDKVLDQLHEYDQLTNVDSLMDAIATGDLDFAAIIKKAMG